MIRGKPITSMNSMVNANGGFGAMSTANGHVTGQSENGLKSCAGGCLALAQELTQA